MSSYLECTARERIAALFDAGSFEEFLPPSERVISPHLAQLDAPVAFDDGVAVGRAQLAADRLRRRAGRRLHGRRGRRSAWRQAGRLLRAPCAKAHGRAAAAGNRRRAPARSQRRPDRGVGSDARRARRARRRHPGDRADRRLQRLLRRHGHRGALRQRGRHVEEGRLAMSGPEVIETATAWRNSMRATARWSGAPPAASTATCWATARRSWWRRRAPRSARPRCDARMPRRARHELTLAALEAEQRMLEARLARFRRPARSARRSGARSASPTRRSCPMLERRLHALAAQHRRRRSHDGLANSGGALFPKGPCDRRARLSSAARAVMAAKRRRDRHHRPRADRRRDRAGAGEGDPAHRCASIRAGRS
jgi:malonate decarboxylase beta subunit